MELIHHRLLGIDLGTGNVHAVLQIRRVQLRQHLSLLHRIPFLHKDIGNTVAVLKGQ